MRTKCITVYKYSELTGKAKERAKEKLCEWITSDVWFDFTINDWEEKLTEAGFTSPEINFSGFSSQGDGASFTASIDLCKAVKGVKRLERFALHADLLGISYKVRRGSSNYSHENTCYIDVDYRLDEKYVSISNRAQDCLEHLQSKRLEFCRQIYKDLYNEYWALQSEESIADFASANDYEFDENGKVA